MLFDILTVIVFFAILLISILQSMEIRELKKILTEILNNEGEEFVEFLKPESQKRKGR